MANNHKYDDIIHLPHHVSPKRARMSMTDRGAQFSPFAALVGYDAAIRETARLTDARLELTEGEILALDEKIQWIRQNLHRQPEVTLTYFVPDERKTGGAYACITGRVKKIDPYGQVLLLADGRTVPFSEIIRIDYEQLD